MMAEKNQFWRWTEADDSKLLALCEARTVSGDDWHEIAVHFPGRSPWACRQRDLNLRRKAQAEFAPKECSGQIVRHTKGRQLPPEISALPQHASITAEIFGDPLPGRSALDRMRLVQA